MACGATYVDQSQDTKTLGLERALILQQQTDGVIE
jgi:hypothetical protein